MKKERLEQIGKEYQEARTNKEAMESFLAKFTDEELAEIRIYVVENISDITTLEVLEAAGYTKESYINKQEEIIETMRLEEEKKYTCKLDLGGSDEDISDWEEGDKEYFELDLEYYEGLIEELESKYDDRLDNIEDYRYTISDLNADDLENLERLFNDTENNLDYCYIKYDFEEKEVI